jgi:thioesterase domain-containing protein
MRPYAGHVTVFSAKWKKPSRILGKAADPTLGWGMLAQGGVDTFSFKGNHQSIYKPPYATALAATLKNILQQLDNEERSSDPKRLFNN